MGLVTRKTAPFKRRMKALADNYFLLFMATEADFVFCVFKQGLIRRGMRIMALVTFPAHYR
jgi:hypothetical protein